MPNTLIKPFTVFNMDNPTIFMIGASAVLLLFIGVLIYVFRGEWQPTKKKKDQK